MPWRCRLWLGIGLLTLAAGCRSEGMAPERVQTGAEDKARRYFEALIHRDWATAYQTLGAESKNRLSAAEFGRLGANYLVNLGFKPTQVYIQACDERGDQAIAHVSIKGGAETSPRFHKDAVALYRGKEGWVVRLPADFGRKHFRNR